MNYNYIFEHFMVMDKLTFLFCGVGFYFLPVKIQVLLYPALMMMKFHKVMLKKCSSVISSE